jgi:hypothetical protein
MKGKLLGNILVRFLLVFIFCFIFCSVVRAEIVYRAEPVSLESYQKELKVSDPFLKPVTTDANRSAQSHRENSDLKEGDKIVNHKGYLGIFDGSLGMFGLELNMDGGRINNAIDGLFYSSIYTRQRWVAGDPYILGLEAGARACNQKELFEKIYVYGGVGVGFDIYSSGGPGFMFGPTDSETNIYLSPAVGMVANLAWLAVFCEAKSIIYSTNSLVLGKIGIGMR